MNISKYDPFIWRLSIMLFFVESKENVQINPEVKEKQLKKGTDPTS